MYPVSPGDEGVKIQPENMEKEKLYHCVFKDKVLLFYKDVQDVLNCAKNKDNIWQRRRWKIFRGLYWAKRLKH